MTNSTKQTIYITICLVLIIFVDPIVDLIAKLFGV